MEQHFIDVNGNYFVAINPIETPEGALVVPPRPASHWNWDGKTWLEGQADPIAVPAVVSRFQAKAALAMAGKLQVAEEAVAKSGNIVLQLAWAEANEFRRDSPGINALAPMVGLDAAGLDDLFIAAAQIEA